MEIKTCEQYVLKELSNTQKELEEVEKNTEELKIMFNNEIKLLNEVIDNLTLKLDELTKLEDVLKRNLRLEWEDCLCLYVHTNGYPKKDENYDYNILSKYLEKKKEEETLEVDPLAIEPKE